VPSDQIYKDTLKALRDRRHFYRKSLEFALSRRIEVWEKQEIARPTPGQLQSNLNVLLLKLASANRETREQLKFFRDSGGNIVQHFPPEDEPEQHKALKARISNIDMLVEDERQGAYLVKTSLGNLVRLCEPAVILDEGHKATSALARQTIEGFNASIVVELSATPPKEANVLVRVSGQELLVEQMIKPPINISNSNQKSWRDFEKVGRKVPWQKLGENFQDETFRFQVLDEGEYADKDWRDDLKKLLESTSLPEIGVYS
jgi:type III restriction enzyme